jgi:hypothetical protein
MAAREVGSAKLPFAKRRWGLLGRLILSSPALDVSMRWRLNNALRGIGTPAGIQRGFGRARVLVAMKASAS